MFNKNNKVYEQLTENVSYIRIILEASTKTIIKELRRKADHLEDSINNM